MAEIDAAVRGGGLTSRWMLGYELVLLKDKHGVDLDLPVPLDAVPHTVPGTHVRSILLETGRSSTWRWPIRPWRRWISQVVSMRWVSRAGADL
ncbi:hypothetical protein [Methylocystis suflitae]|uniref:hypothetical protein n=1 Tax=Methylocystis suflitae TaxID=2951405 RepID=UPI00210AF4B2|nr:hypothetical protein [Methylocystis suflitae]MCQ4190941.1 hypothetical protein [Methylocystis suflitae]